MGCWYCYQIGPVRRPGMGSCRGSSPSLCSPGFVIYKLMYYYFCVAREIPTLTVDVILTLLRPSFFFLSIHQAFAMYTTWVSSYWTSIKSFKKKPHKKTQSKLVAYGTRLFCSVKVELDQPLCDLHTHFLWVLKSTTYLIALMKIYPYVTLMIKTFEYIFASKGT